jgi:hypothetical protein
MIALTPEQSGVESSNSQTGIPIKKGTKTEVFMLGLDRVG